jgi:peptidoglycan DL-endopeptidase CwlO
VNPDADPVRKEREKGRVTQVHTPPAIRKIVRRRVAVLTASVFAGGVLLGVTGSAGAAPMPTIAQVQHRLSQLESRAEKLDQQYDQVQQELAATDQQLGVVNKAMAATSREYGVRLKELQRLAVTAYEEGGSLDNTSLALLTSGNPQQILNQSSILLELSNINNAQIGQFLAEAKHLTATQELSVRTELAIRQLRDELGARKRNMDKLVSQEQTLLASLTPAQQTAVQQAVGPGGASTKKTPYNGPTGTQADAAVQYAYNQVGCPYVYGGTGPCLDGFDCSGLTMEAWAAAGVSIPRTSYEQWDELPHVSLSDLQPGDILVFNDAGHVGIYIGDNKLIDAPQTGMDVEIVAFSGWYRETVDGAVRP